MNLKIQILAGNTLMLRFHVGFEIELPLVQEKIVKSYTVRLRIPHFPGIEIRTLLYVMPHN